MFWALACHLLGLKNILFAFLMVELFWINAELSFSLHIVVIYSFIGMFKNFIIFVLKTRLVKNCLLKHSRLVPSLNFCKRVVCV